MTKGMDGWNKTQEVYETGVQYTADVQKQKANIWFISKCPKYIVKRRITKTETCV